MSNSSVPLLSAHSITKSFGRAPHATKSSSTSPPTSTPANVWP